MSNEIVNTTRDDDDDGFGGANGKNGRLIKGTFCRWTDAAGWHDRDGQALPSPMLIVGLIECNQRFIEKKPIVVTEKPLKDVNQLNAEIPIAEWPLFNGVPQPTWKRAQGCYLASLANGAMYTYLNSTTGTHMCIDAVREQTSVTRMLRGAKVFPVVELISKPWKTNYGQRMRPVLNIIDWKTPSSGLAVTAPAPAPQLPGPAEQKPPKEPIKAEIMPPLRPATPPAAAPSAPEPKPAAQVAAETLANMEPVAPITMKEIMDDEIPW
jgi:hypothetical protein